MWSNFLFSKILYFWYAGDNLKSQNLRKMIGFMTTAVFPGGLCGCSRMAALKEGRRLASVQKHLHGLVCDGAHFWPDQCRHHGNLHLWHPMSIWAHPKQGRRKKPLQWHQTERSRKAKIYRLPQANNFGRKGKKKIEMFGRTCDMGLWFLAASFST